MIILFDLDDTLINTKYTVETAAAHLFKKNVHAFPHHSREQFLAAWHESLPKYFKFYEIGKMSLYDLGINRILDLSEQEVTKKQAKAMYEGYLQILNTSTVLFDDAIPCLEQLKDYRLGVITNGQTKLQSKKIQDVELHPWFEHMVISEQVGVAKPHPHIFEFTKGLFQADEEQFLYIGDKLDSDAQASTKSGFIGVWLNRNGQKSEYNLDGVEMIDTLAKLPSLVAKYAEAI